MTGIVSEHLTKTLSEDIRTKGLLVWLDGDGVYTEYVDTLREGAATGVFPYPVFAFRGSFVRLMRESYPTLAGAGVPRCVIHLPGFSEDSIKATPLYEAYKAGRRWRIALETVVREAGQGHLTPPQVDTLIDREDLTLETADQFLAEHVEVTPELRALLTHYGEDGLIITLLTDPHALVSAFAGTESALVAALLRRLERQIGMEAQWIQDWGESVETIGDLVDATWAFLLCREYAVDMLDQPSSDRLVRLRELSREYHRAGSGILGAIRRDHADAYVTCSDQVAAALQGAEVDVPPAMLGKIDTFRFEAEIFLAEAFRLLDTGRWADAGKLADIRLTGGRSGSHTFWVSRDPTLSRAWKWVAAAAALGDALAAVENTTPSGVLSRQAHAYRDETWHIDQLHRQFAVQSINLGSNGIDAQMAAFSRVRSGLMGSYREWIDRTIRAWNTACEEHGFLPPADERQRSFYRSHVAPALQDGTKTAVILADALRYELGRELEEHIRGERIGETRFSMMLAELPTVTAVGMSALTPTVDGEELVPTFSADRSKITGFRGGSRDVTKTSTRHKTFSDVSGVSCEWQDMNAFLDLSVKEASRAAEHQLLIIATGTVDSEGEGDALASGIDYFESAMTRIIIAVRRLVKLGYRRIVITADHGFIIGDDTVQTARAPKLPAVDRRHAVGEPRFGDELVSVRLPQLQYRADSAPEAIIFHRESHILSSRPAGSFYHGGNSPQERIVPVITINAGTGGTREPGTYRLSYEALPDALNTHRIKVIATEKSSPALFEKEPVEVRIMATDADTVTVADVVNGEAVGDLVTLTSGMPCEIYFRLRGGNPRSRLRFKSARPNNVIENDESPEYFDVDISGSNTGSNEPQAPAPNGAAGQDSSWQHVVDEAYHVAIRHLESHGAMSIRFLENSLGGGSVGARKARRFAIRLDEWQPFLPFRVTVHDTAEGKEYRKS
ncbi:MAG: BREX-6 system phosphatase PglZ [Alkalispirochaeta sp.]